MSRDNSQPFNRGETYYGLDGTIDTAALTGGQHPGVEKEFEDIDYSSTNPGAKPVRSNFRNMCRIFRNSSGITLLPKRLAVINPANPGEVLGYSNADSQDVVAIDEFLPAAGVRNGDLFWGVVSGYATLLTPVAGANFGGADFTTGVRLHSLTSSAASTSTASTGEQGRPAIYQAALTTVANAIAFSANFVGTALSARTTGNTNADVLVLIRRRRA